jgi:hypothetical protein
MEKMQATTTDGEGLSLTDFIKLAPHVVLRHKEMVTNPREEQRNGRRLTCTDAGLPAHFLTWKRLSGCNLVAVHLLRASTSDRHHGLPWSALPMASALSHGSKVASGKAMHRDKEQAATRMAVAKQHCGPSCEVMRSCSQQAMAGPPATKEVGSAVYRPNRCVATQTAAKEGEEGAAPMGKMWAAAMGKKRAVRLDLFFHLATSLGLEEWIDRETPGRVQVFSMYPSGGGGYVEISRGC